MGKTNGQAPKHPPRLHFGRLKEAPHARREMFAEVPSGTNPEDLLNPAYWAHYAADLRTMDIIEVFCEDGLWEASYRVMFSGEGQVRLSQRLLVSHDQLNTDEIEELSDKYFVKFRGPAVRWSVLRKSSDGSPDEVIRDRFQEKRDALQYMKTL